MVVLDLITETSIGKILDDFQFNRHDEREYIRCLAYVSLLVGQGDEDLFVKGFPDCVKANKEMVLKTWINKM